MPGPIVAAAIRTGAAATATDALDDKKNKLDIKNSKNYMDLNSLRGAKERNSPDDTQDNTEVNVSVEPTEPIRSRVETQPGVPDVPVVEVNQEQQEYEEINVLKEISSKISALTNMIAQKFVGSPVLDMPEPTTEEVIKQGIDDKTKADTDPAKVLDPEQGASVAQKTDDKTDKDTKKSTLDAIKKGFGKLQRSSDSIASLLFKRTITAALESAKFAAMVFSIILALDLLKIHFSYWMEKLLAWWEGFKADWFANWQTYFSEWGKWGTILDTISTSIGRILNTIRTGDFPGLIHAITKGLVETGQTIAESIRLAIFKGIASVLRNFGFDGAAETVEGYALEKYSKNANGNLSEEEQQKLAQYQAEQNEKEPTILDTVIKHSPIGVLQRVGEWVGDTIKGTRGVQTAYNNSMQSIKGMPKAEQEQIIMAMNQARKAGIDYVNHAESVNVGNSADVERLRKSYEETQRIISDKRLDAVPELRKELQNNITEANKDLEKRMPKPSPPTNSKDSASAQRIIKADQKPSPSNNSNSNVNAMVNNTKVVQNRQIMQMNPVTGSRAPGVFGATGVN